MQKTGVIFAIVRDNKILMQQRDKNCSRFPLRWCLPGGSQENGEDFETTLLREIKEEYDLDLNIKQCSYLMDYNDGADKVYICKLNFNQEPKLNEGFAMRWMTIDEVKKLEIGFNQKGIVPFLNKAV